MAQQNGFGLDCWCPARPAVNRGALDARSGTLLNSFGWAAGVLLGWTVAPWTPEAGWWEIRMATLLREGSRGVGKGGSARCRLPSHAERRLKS